MINSLSIYCDGGARGNPGPGAIAFVVIENKKIIYKFSKRIGKTTNNVAEYQAVISALEWLIGSEMKKGWGWEMGYGSGFEDENEGKKKKLTHTTHPRPITHNSPPIHFYLDSQLIVNQLNGFFKIKDAKLRVLIIKVRSLEQQIRGKIFYHLISRRQNKIADTLINQSLNSFHVGERYV